MPWLDSLHMTIRSCRTVIWIASWLVPKPLRHEWKELWSSNIWHWANYLAESGRLDAANRLKLVRHCRGAFDEALWLRFDREEFLERQRRLLRSPAFCLTACFVLLLSFVLAGGFISRTRSMFSSPVVQPDHVAVVSFDGKYVRIRSETLLYLDSVWRSSPVVSDFALYSWGPGQLSDSSGQVALVESRVAPGFFELIGVRLALGRFPHPSSNFECADCVVLSHDFWRMHFKGDRGIIGRQVMVDGHPRKIAGVLPQNFGLLSSSAAVWTVLDESTPRFSNFLNRVGAVARLRDGATPAQLQRDLLDRSENVGYRFTSAPMRVVSLKTQSQHLLWAYGAFLLLALLCAGGIAWMLRSGAGGFGPMSLEGRQCLRWWAFFLAKSAALTASAYLFSWIVVHRLLGIYPMADEIAVWTFLPVAVAVLSWSIVDQQKRCRVCLGRLSMAVDIGRAGSVLLNWAGTEMVCSEGHGTLYMSESEANSLERDRWSTLDDSWAGLFRTG
jgi:hypothetical protein